MTTEITESSIALDWIRRGYRLVRTVHGPGKRFQAVWAKTGPEVREPSKLFQRLTRYQARMGGHHE